MLLNAELNVRYDENGNCKGKPRFDWKAPKKLSWDLPTEVAMFSIRQIFHYLAIVFNNSV